MQNTEARINQKTGVADHKHDDFGWHWACADHRDAGEIHNDANAAAPSWSPSHREAELYIKALSRQIIHRIDDTVEYVHDEDALRFPYPNWRTK